MGKRLLPLLVVALGIGMFVLLQVTRTPPPAVDVAERVWPVSTVEVSLGTHHSHVSLYGEVVAPGRVTITAPLPGRIAERPVMEGSRVEAGDLLVALDDDDIQPVVVQAEAELARIEAELEAQHVRFASDTEVLTRENELLANARQQVERMRSLVRRNLASRAELDQYENDIARAEVTRLTRQGELNQQPARVAELEAQRAAARAQLNEARRDAERARAHAEFAAIVTELAVAPGDRVREGDALLDIIPLRGMEVRARVSADLEPELLEALAASSALLAHDSQGNRYRLRGMAGVGDPAGTEAIFTSDRPPLWLRPGKLVTLSLERPATETSLVVPHDALYGNDLLYIVEESRLLPLPVTYVGEIPGPDGSPWALVKGTELVDGQRVVTTHLPNAVDGLAVEPVSVDSGTRASQEDAL